MIEMMTTMIMILCRW